MKVFKVNSGYYALTVFKLLRVAIETEDKIASRMAREICEDAYYLSNGDGNLSIEFLRIAGTFNGGRICHLLISRSFSKIEETSKILNNAFCTSIREQLTRYGYIYSEMPFELFSELYYSANRSAIWAITKQEIREQELMSPNTNISLPVLCDSVDMRSVYKALDGSGCTLSIQVTTSSFTDQEIEVIQQFYADTSRASDGSYLSAQLPRDNLAFLARKRWEYYVKKSAGPSAIVNILVSGPSEKAAIVVARLRGNIKELNYDTAATLRAFDITSSDISRIFDLPWKCESIVSNECHSAGFLLAKSSITNSIIRKYSSDEIGGIMALPTVNDSFIGIEGNSFSLLKNNLLIQKNMLNEGTNKVILGKTDSGNTLYLPIEDLLLHLAVIGKSGVGKTTLLMTIIDQLSRKGIPVFIMEPIKREYRTLVRQDKTQVFTADSMVSPFILNPFLVPKNVTLAQYRHHLLNAFNAAFSMPDPLPSLFGASINEAYALNGWKGSSKSTDPDVKIFGLWEFVQVFQRVVKKSGYSSEIKGNMMSGGTFRLLSLIDRCKNTFESVNSIDVEDLLNGQVVLELGRLEGEQKCLVAALTLISILSYLRISRESGCDLKNVILIDEAHVLLDNGLSRTEEGRAIGGTMELLIANLVSEVRALGVGIILADQSPSRLGNNLLDNTDNKIIFRLSGIEAQIITKGVGLDDRESRILPMLDKGEALFINHSIHSAVGLHTTNRTSLKPVSEAELSKYEESYTQAHAKIYRPFRECTSSLPCSNSCDFKVRDIAATKSVQMFGERRDFIKTHDDLIKHLLWIPSSLIKQGYSVDDNQYSRLCSCVKVHFSRRVSLDIGLNLSDNLLRSIIANQHDLFRKDNDHE